MLAMFLLIPLHHAKSALVIDLLVTDPLLIALRAGINSPWYTNSRGSPSLRKSV